MDFGKVLTRSWELIWKYKALWIFGILASCGGQVSRVGGRGSNFSIGSRDARDLPPQMERLFNEWGRQITQFFNERGVIFAVGLACAALILVLIFWILGVYGRVGLIKGVLNAEAGRPVAFRAVASQAREVLGAALGLNFVLALLPIGVAVLLFALAVPIGIFTLGIGLLCFIPLLCLLLPLGIAYSVYVEMANIALVRAGRGVGAALTNSWEMFRTNLGNLAGMGLILILGGVFVTAVLSAPLLAVLAPAFFALIGNDPQAVAPALRTTGILLIIAIPVYILLGGIIRSYVQSAWTLTYLQLTPAPKARVKVKTSRR